MLSVVTTLWFDASGRRAMPPADGRTPDDRWAADARSRLGWAQIVVRDRDATLHYDPDRVAPEALQAAGHEIDRRGAALASVTIVRWHGDAIAVQALSHVTESSDLYASLASF